MPEDTQNTTPVVQTSAPSSRTLWLLVLGLLVIATGYYFWKTPMVPSAPDYSTESTPFTVLVSDNQAFAEATALDDSGQYALAKVKYEEALASAADSQQRAQIKFKIASMDEELGNYVDAIRAYKALVTDPDSYDFIQAYSVQRLGWMFYTYGYEHPEIDAEVFVGEPYASFKEEGDSPATAYRRIFEYASTFRPLAYGEARVADWYANEATLLSDAGSSEEEIAELVEMAKAALARVDADISRVQDDPNEQGIVSSVTIRKGEVLGKLARLGAATEEEAENAFKSGLTLASLGGAGADGYARFHYASYLERISGDTRADEIIALMSPFYRAPESYAQTPAVAFIRSQRNQNTWMHDSLIGIAQMDAAFEAYLISLGWDASLFN